MKIVTDFTLWFLNYQLSKIKFVTYESQKIEFKAAPHKSGH